MPVMFLVALAPVPALAPNKRLYFFWLRKTGQLRLRTYGEIPVQNSIGFQFLVSCMSFKELMKDGFVFTK